MGLEILAKVGSIGVSDTALEEVMLSGSTRITRWSLRHEDRQSVTRRLR